MAFSIGAMAVPSVWLLYFARRHAQGRSARQVSLLGLLGGISLACCLLALLAWDRQSVLQTRSVRERLQAEIMTIVCDGTVRVSGNPGTTLISVKRSSFNDDDLKAILELTDQLGQANAPITLLDLSGTIVTDQGVSSLTRLESLEYCFLERTPVSDASIDVLEQLPKLRVVSVMATRVTVERLLELSLERPSLNIEPKSYVRLGAD